MPPETITNLRDAADQPARADSDDATITMPIGVFKESVDWKIKATNKEFNSPKEELVMIASRLETLRSVMAFQIELLASELTKIRLESITQDKERRIEWAISNCGLKSFKFFTKDGGWQDIDSKYLIQEILFSFRRGHGRYIRGMSSTRYNNNAGDTHKGEEQFRVKLKDQLAHLLGKEPRVAKEEQGYAIYYS